MRAGPGDSGQVSNVATAPMHTAARRLPSLLPPGGARQLIIDAHHRAVQTTLGWRWKRAGLDIAMRSAPQVVAEVVEANNSGDWAATEGAGRARSRVTIAVIITVTSARQTEDDLVAVGARRGQPRHRRSGQRKRRR